MSIVASPTQQGVTPLPSAAHLQTSILNGTVRVASSTNPGLQNAVYTISGGPITSNVNLALPTLSADDTIATLNANNTWTGQHSFAAGLNASGPINSTAPITTSSSITGSSILSQGGITSNGPIISNGDLTTTGNLVVVGNFNPSNLSTPGTLSVGTNATITGTHTVSGLSTLGNITTAGQHTINPGGFLYHKGTQFTHNPTQGGGVTNMQLINYAGGADGDYYHISTGQTRGLYLTSSTFERVAFYGGSHASGFVPAPASNSFLGNTSGYQIPDSSWTNKNLNMLQQAFNTLIEVGLLQA